MSKSLYRHFAEILMSCLSGFTRVFIIWQVVEAKENEIKINEAREHYRPAAARAALLYFVMSDLSKINPIYQFSLKVSMSSLPAQCLWVAFQTFTYFIFWSNFLTTQTIQKHLCLHQIKGKYPYIRKIFDLIQRKNTSIMENSIYVFLSLSG